MAYSRRNFLRSSCSSVAALGLTGAFGRFGAMNLMAQSTDYKALVCIFLVGGNDGNNLLVPLDSTRFQQYTNVRGQLALTQAQLLAVTAQTGSAAYGLHPALPELQPIFNQKKLAFVANVGMLVQPTTQAQYQQQTANLPTDLFNHAGQQSQWQSSIANSAGQTGWAGRAADAMSPVYASSSGFPIACSVAGNTLMLTGQSTQPAGIVPGGALTVSGSDGSAAAVARDNAFQQLLTFNSGLSVVQAASSQMSSALQVDAVLAKAIAGAPALTTVFPSTPLGQQLQQIAQIIQVRAQLGMKRQIFFCSLTGFDTHYNQMLYQQNSLAPLSQGMSAFYKATQELGVSQQVTTFTESEFGRTLQPSSGVGTDHAWGSHHIIMGDAVFGGDVYGTFPQLVLNGPDDATGRGTWIPTTAVDQFGATLADWFGLNSASLNSVFPNLVNFATQKLGFLG